LTEFNDLSFSLSLNSSHGPTSEAVKLAVLAEKNGLDCVWYCQDLFQRDAWVFLTATATHTKTINLGTGIVTPYTVNPAELVMHAATLDEYSGGRVRLGISVGAVEFLKWIGIKAKNPVSGMREAISIIRRLLHGERVIHNGRVFKDWSNDAYLRFKPIREDLPIYLGAQSPRLLELTGELADGGLPLLFPPEYFEQVLKRIQKGTEKAGRNLEDLDIVGCIWFSVSNNRDSAMDALRGLVSYYGPHLTDEMIKYVGLRSEDFNPIREVISKRDYEAARKLMTDDMANLAIFGTPDDCVDRIEKLIEKGLKHVRFGPPLGPDPETTIQLLGHKIIPHFKEK
jgi:5,10-methylenetetrahydromethanopterin reductase